MAMRVAVRHDGRSSPSRTSGCTTESASAHSTGRAPLRAPSVRRHRPPRPRQHRDAAPACGGSGDSRHGRPARRGATSGIGQHQHGTSTRCGTSGASARSSTVTGSCGLVSCRMSPSTRMPATLIDQRVGRGDILRQIARRLLARTLGNRPVHQARHRMRVRVANSKPIGTNMPTRARRRKPQGEAIGRAPHRRRPQVAPHAARRMMAPARRSPARCGAAARSPRPASSRRPSHQASDEHTWSKPIPSSRGNTARSTPGVQARNSASRCACFSAPIKRRQSEAGAWSGSRQRNPATPARTQTIKSIQPPIADCLGDLGLLQPRIGDIQPMRRAQRIGQRTATARREPRLFATADQLHRWQPDRSPDRASTRSPWLGRLAGDARDALVGRARPAQRGVQRLMIGGDEDVAARTRHERRRDADSVESHGLAAREMRGPVGRGRRRPADADDRSLVPCVAWFRLLRKRRVERLRMMPTPVCCSRLA